MMYTVPYKKEALRFELPAAMRVEVVTSKPIAPIPDPRAAIWDAVAHPIDSPRLIEMARPGDRVAIIFTDITRASPDHLFMPPVLDELAQAGVRDEDITLICGVGMHRPSTDAEKVEKLGRDLVERYRVIDHNASDPSGLVDLGTTESGVPLSVNKVAYESDVLIATGLVEPHQYAGYSGGSKTLSIGAGGEKMIAYTHGPIMLDHPGTRLGQIEGNPFQEAVTEAARRAGLRFVINAVLNDDKQIVAVRAGAPQATHRALVEEARVMYEAPIDRQFDIAIGGVGYPKDENLYQASRAASYLYFAPTPVVKPGGFFIIPAPCNEGAGDGIGEQRFLKAMQDAPDIPSILRDAREHGYPPGQQRAFVMATVLEQTRVIIVGADDPDLIRSAKFMAEPTMEAAIARAAGELGSDLDVLIVPHALLTLPIVQNSLGHTAH
jgi:lactate racemase